MFVLLEMEELFVILGLNNSIFLFSKSSNMLFKLTEQDLVDARRSPSWYVLSILTGRDHPCSKSFFSFFDLYEPIS